MMDSLWDQSKNIQVQEMDKQIQGDAYPRNSANQWIPLAEHGF